MYQPTIGWDSWIYINNIYSLFSIVKHFLIYLLIRDPIPYKKVIKNFWIYSWIEGTTIRMSCIMSIKLQTCKLVSYENQSLSHPLRKSRIMNVSKRSGSSYYLSIGSSPHLSTILFPFWGNIYWQTNEHGMKYTLWQHVATYNYEALDRLGHRIITL